MESSGSSFIPQRPARGKVAAKSFRKIYVLSYVSYLIFFSTLLAVAGVFFYKLSLQAQLQGLKEDLVAQKNLFNQTDLDRIRNLDNRIDAATQLVQGHVSLLTIFSALAENITDPVQFLSFNYDRREDARTPKLALSATAKDFDEVIFQKKVFGDAKITGNFFVDNVSLSTQPVDQERLELGVEQVVNVNLTADLVLSDINFTGYTAVPAPGGGREAGSVPSAVTDSDLSDTTDSADASADVVDDSVSDTVSDTTTETDAVETDETTSSDAF